MKLLSVEGVDFLSFEKIEYNFVDRPLMVQGKNLTDDDQESNGSGKSSLQSLIEYCLTGSTSRGVRDTEIVRFGAKKSEINLRIKCDVRKETLLIEWTVKIKGSNLLSITRIFEDGSEEEVVFSTVNDGKKYIENWLAITNEDLFNYFLINQKRFKSFFASSNKEKVALINRFSDASVIEGIENVDSSELESKYKEIGENISKCDGKIESKKDDLYDEENRDIDNEFNLKKEELKEEIKDIELEISDLLDESNEYLDNEAKIKAQINSFKESNSIYLKESTKLLQAIKTGKESLIPIKESLEKAQLAVDSFKKIDLSEDKKVYRDKISEIDSKALSTEKELNKVKKQKETILKMLEGVKVKLSGSIECPSCSYEFMPNGEKSLEELEKNKSDLEGMGVSVNKLTENLESKLELLEIDLQEPKQKIEDLSEQEIEQNRSINTLLEKVNEINLLIVEKNKELEPTIRLEEANRETISSNNKTITELEGKILASERKRYSIENDIKNYKKDIVTIKKEIDSLSKENNLDTIEAIKDSIKQFEEEKKNLELKYKEVEDELFKINQWKKNFKQFKMHIANKSLETMEYHCNRYLKGMGSDMEIVMDGYKVLADGTIKDEITAKIIRNGERSFNSFSGGERGRLLFCAILANRHMINSTHPYGGLDFLSIDEIFEGVDGLGLQKLVSEAKKLQTCIMIITHVTNETVSEDILRFVRENGVTTIE